MTDSPAAISLPKRLGWVSFFNDISSETLTRVVGLYMATALGAAGLWVGATEGLAEATALVVKTWSGAYSDRLPSRKPMVSVGYGVSLASRALMLLGLTSPSWLSSMRILDRFGKGIRAAPRDAMVADVSTSSNRGHAFGWLRFLDTLGAMLGLGLVLALTSDADVLGADVFRRILLIALIPGLAALLFLWFAVPRVANPHPQSKSWVFQMTSSPEVRRYLMLVFLFGLSNSSDVFLLLRAKELGLSFPLTLALLIVFNAVSAFSAIPFGKLSDRWGRRGVLQIAWGFYAACYLGFGLLDGVWAFSALFVAYGLFAGLSEGVEKAYVADLSPQEGRGRGFGLFQLATGSSAILGNLLTGAISDLKGLPWALTTCAALAAFAAVLFAFYAPRLSRPLPSVIS